MIARPACCKICGCKIDSSESARSLMAKGWVFFKGSIIDGLVERPDIRMIFCPDEDRAKVKKATMDVLYPEK